MRADEATEIVSDLAAQQWGLVTSAQARKADVAAFMLSRLVDRGILTRLRHGVYATTSTPLNSVLEVRSQWMALNPTVMAADRRHDSESDVVVSHETAAEMHGIGDLPSNMITFTTARRRQTKQPDVQFYVAALASDEIVYIDGLPVTTAARTVLDLARAGHEPGHLRDMITDAVSNSLATKDELATSLADMAESLGATSNTETDMRKLLDGLVSSDEAGQEWVRQAIQESLEPIQKDLQKLAASIGSSETRGLLQVLGQYTESFPAVSIDPRTLSAIQKVVADNAIAQTGLGLVDGALQSIIEPVVHAASLIHQNDIHTGKPAEDNAAVADGETDDD